MNNYMAGLMKHLHAKHPQVGVMMTQHGAAFMELLFLRNFKTTDPELTEMQDRVRWQIHQQTLKARYPDENLKEQAEELARRLAMQIRARTDRRGILEHNIDLRRTAHVGIPLYPGCA